MAPKIPKVACVGIIRTRFPKGYQLVRIELPEKEARRYMEAISEPDTSSVVGLKLEVWFQDVVLGKIPTCVYDQRPGKTNQYDPARKASNIAGKFSSKTGKKENRSAPAAPEESPE